MQNMKIVNKVVSVRKMLKMYKNGYLPTIIGTTEVEESLLGTTGYLFDNLYLCCSGSYATDDYEDLYLLNPESLEERGIKPTELIMSNSKYYKIKEICGITIDELGGFICKTKENKKRFFSMSKLKHKAMKR